MRRVTSPPVGLSNDPLGVLTHKVTLVQQRCCQGPNCPPGFWALQETLHALLDQPQPETYSISISVPGLTPSGQNLPGIRGVFAVLRGESPSQAETLIPRLSDRARQTDARVIFRADRGDRESRDQLSACYTLPLTEPGARRVLGYAHPNQWLLKPPC